MRTKNERTDEAAAESVKTIKTAKCNPTDSQPRTDTTSTEGRPACQRNAIIKSERRRGPGDHSYVMLAVSWDEGYPKSR